MLQKTKYVSIIRKIYFKYIKVLRKKSTQCVEMDPVAFKLLNVISSNYYHPCINVKVVG